MLRLLILITLLLFLKSGIAQVNPDSLKPGIVLEKVTVKNKKPFIEQAIDKTIVNVQADLLAMGSSAFEIIRRLPGISVTGEDAIGMSGKSGINVLIDGRPTQLAGRDLANYLRALPGGSIDKIELIANPSARFDAQGNAGIINIRLKKILVRGTHGNLGLGYGRSDHYRSNASFQINHRRNRLHTFASISGNNNLQYTFGHLKRQLPDGRDFNNETVDQDRNTDLNYRAGFDFFLNKKSTFGLLVSGYHNRSPFQTPGTTLMSSNGNIDSSLLTQNNNLFRNNRINTNINYHYEDSLGQELNLDADHTLFSNSNYTSLTTTFLDQDKNRYNYKANLLDVATRINIYALKADYSRKWKTVKLETGVKISSVQTANKLAARHLQSGSMKPDTGRSNRFDYSETVYAAYLSVGRSNKKWEYQAGLRAEQSRVKGVSEDLDNNRISKPDTTYFNLFPTLFIAFRPNEKNRIGLAAGQRINRPDYQSLNPFETIIDIYSGEKGNPFLRPEYSSNIELKYTYRNAFNLALGYNHTKDFSQNITRQTAERISSSPVNLGSRHNLYFNIASPLPITPWWDGYLSVTGFYNEFRGSLPEGELKRSTLGLNYYIQQNLRAGKGWSFQVSSWYNAPVREGIFRTRSLGSLDLGVKKSIMKDKGAIRLSMSDLLNTQRWEQDLQFAGMNLQYRRKWESRSIRLQFNWKFGQNKFETRHRETNEDASRIKMGK